jgi:hypothetical protein
MATSITALKKELRKRIRTILSDVSDAAIALQSESKALKLPAWSRSEMYLVLVY